MALPPNYPQTALLPGQMGGNRGPEIYGTAIERCNTASGGTGATGAAGPTGPAGPTGAAGPVELFLYQSETIDLGHNFDNESTFVAANFSVGTLYSVQNEVTVTGIKFYWGQAATKSVKVSLWSWDGVSAGTRVATETVTATSGDAVVVVPLTTPYLITGANLMKRYVAAMWIADGSGYIYYTVGDSATAPQNPKIVGRGIVQMGWMAASAGDTFSNGYDANPSVRYAVDMIPE